jgi:cysteine-S-conjugate beta-lyase
MHDSTRCVHRPPVSQEGFASLTVPTYRASTIVYDSPEAFAKRRQRGPDGYMYGTYGTPTTRALEAQLTELQGGVRTVLLPSGLAAVTIVMLATLMPGDRVLIPDNIYPPGRAFCANYLKPRGIDHLVYDPLIGVGIADLIDSRTKLLWLESPGSATMEVQDVPTMAKAAKQKGALVACDNTWASPLLFKPLEHGADFVVEALTKFVGGHSDLLLGSVTVADLGLRQRLKDAINLIGISVSPDECALALRGLQTMAVRLAHVGRASEAIARRLQKEPIVERVLHPALPSCPGHEIWKRDFKGASSLFSIVLKSGAEANLHAALSGLKLFSIGASWGGTHSLIAPVSLQADRTVNPWQGGQVVRINIGLEDENDLWEELSGILRTLEGGRGAAVA